MGLLGSLRQAEQQVRERMSPAYPMTGDTREDAERRIRRNMRIHPHPAIQAPRATSVATSGQAAKAK